MAGEPIQLPDGSTITSWDPTTIDVTSAAGQTMKVARQAAPAALREAVDMADAGGLRGLGYAGLAQPQVVEPPAAAPAPAAPVAPPQMSLREQGFAGVAPGAPAAQDVAPGAGAPAAAPPAAAPGPAAAVAPIGGNPLQPINEQIAAYRAMPQTVGVGGGTRVVTQTSGPPTAAVDAAREAGVDADIANEAIAGELEREGELRSEQEAEFAQTLGEQVRFEEQAIADEQADSRDYQQRVAVETDKLAKLQEQSKAEIDPNKFWKDRGTGKKILGALMQGLGAFGAALTGGQNSAMAVIDQAIARDIDAQLQSREGARQKSADQAGLVRLLGDQYASRADQRRAGIMLGREHAATVAERLSALTNVEAVKSQYLQKADALRAQNAREQQAFILQTAGNVTQTKTPTAGGAQPSAAARAAAALSAMTYTKFDPEAVIPAAERYAGVPMQAIGGKEDARAINKQMASVEQMMTKLGKLEQMGKQGFSSLQDKTTAGSLMASLILDAKNIDEAGALDIGAERIVREQLGPNPADWVKTGRTAIPTVSAALRSKIHTTLSNRAAAVDPTTVPLSMRARFAPGAAAGGSGGGRPQTQPLTEGTL